MASPPLGSVVGLGTSVIDKGYPFFVSEDTAGNIVTPSGHHGWNPTSNLWVPMQVDSNGIVQTALMGSDGTLPYVTGYIQNISAGTSQANQTYPIPGIVLPQAVIGSSPVAGSVAYSDVFFPPLIQVAGYNNVMVWYEGINNASFGFYPYQLYGPNPGGSNAQGFTRGGASTNIPSALNAKVGTNSLIFWFQPPVESVLLAIANATSSTSPATIDFTGIGFYATR